MDWKDVGNTVAQAAPLVGTLLGGPAGGAVGGLVAKALGTDADPSEVASMIQADPKALERIKQMEFDHKQTLERMHLEAETNRIAAVNTTMRAEAASNDAYVRRWRPTFGYLTAIAWVAQSGAIAWVIIAQPSEAGAVAQAITALTPMWGVALAVLGINVSKRSQDKQVSAGQKPDSGLIGALAQKLAK